jgi:high affinity sulfate transporter 1
MRLAGYRLRWLLPDSFAGLTVAAMAIPQCMAVAQLAGLPPVTGLYGVIPAMVLYGLFGSSRRLMVGPEPTLAVLFAQALAPLASGDPDRYASLAAAMALLCGGFLVLGSLFRLGFVADFLPHAVVVGYLNGVSIALIIDQLGPLTHISLEATRPLPALGQFVAELGHVHMTTLITGVCVLAVVLGLRALYAPLPGALIGVVGAAIAVAAGGAPMHGLLLVGNIPAGLPRPRLPGVSASDLVALIPGALAAATLIFTDGVITARAVARSDDIIDDDRELRGFGAASLSAGLCQGFPVGVSASRSVVASATGARSQLTGWTAAAAIAVVLVWLTGPLAYIPRTALAAVIVAAALSLFSFAPIAVMWRVQRVEAVLCVATTIAVLVLGLLQAVGLGVLVALGILVKRAARPHHAVLGAPHGVDGFHDITRYRDAETEPGLIAYRFDAPLFSANADYLRTEVISLVDAAATPVLWFVLDAEAITTADTAALAMLSRLEADLRQRGVSLVFARVKGPLYRTFERAGLVEEVGVAHFFPTVTASVEAYRELAALRHSATGRISG